MTTPHEPDRRDFLKEAAVAGAGIALLAFSFRQVQEIVTLLPEFLRDTQEGGRPVDWALVAKGLSGVREVEFLIWLGATSLLGGVACWRRPGRTPGRPPQAWRTPTTPPTPPMTLDLRLGILPRPCHHPRAPRHLPSRPRHPPRRPGPLRKVVGMPPPAVMKAAPPWPRPQKAWAIARRLMAPPIVMYGLYCAPGRNPGFRSRAPTTSCC